MNTAKRKDGGFFYDDNCSGLSTGARIGIGVGVAVGCLILIALIGALIRRRRQRAWQQHAQAVSMQNQNPYAQYGHQQYNADGTPMYAPPPPNNGGHSYQPQYQPQYQYAPPPTAPPQAYSGAKV